MTIEWKPVVEGIENSLETLIVFPDVIPREDRVALLKLRYSGKEIEDMALMIAGFKKTTMED